MKRLRPAQLEQEIEEELRFHLEMRAQQNRAAGMSAEAAQAAALERFGNYQAVNAACRALARARLANSPARRILNSLILALFGGGVAVRWLSDAEVIQRCGTALLLIAVLWRLLLYVRLSSLVRKPITATPSSILPLDTQSFTS